jgi:Zn-dependent protease
MSDEKEIPFVKTEVKEECENDEEEKGFFRPSRQNLIFMIVIFLLTVVLLSLVLGWNFALLLLFSLSVHEAGHLWAMRRCGMQLRGLYFIPFVGVAAVPTSNFSSRADETFMAIMGPAWGTLLGIVSFLLYLITGWSVFTSLTIICVFINLLNLLPVAPLDGGRVVRGCLHAFSPTFSFYVCLVFFLIMPWVVFPLSWILSVLLSWFGLQELLRYRREIHLEDDYQRIYKTLLALGKEKIDSLLRDGKPILEAMESEENAPLKELRVIFDKINDDSDYQEMIRVASAARKERFHLYPFGFYAVTPDFRDGLDLCIYLTEHQNQTASTVISKKSALRYLSFFFLLAGALLWLGLLCSAVVQ